MPNFVGDPGGYSPAYLQSAYNAPITRGAGETVAVVDAYNAPHAESDLATYRATYGLPPCTTANGCFRKIDQNGGTNYPAADSGWAQEISLDVDMVSAVCPNCKIMLVEADDSYFDNLGAAVNKAVQLGASVVSNSYGGAEFPTEVNLDALYFDHPGVAILASSGDSGFGVNYPAASPSVIAVGGTSLLQATDTGTRDAIETVWPGAGSGCSVYEAKPAWQTDTSCSSRTVADVAAVANPSTGVNVYDGGWGVFGGTSAASPIVAALYALAENDVSSDQVAAYPYAHPTALNDVVSGSNGSCGGIYLCTAGVGYDGPTGLGTPNATGAFMPSATDPNAPVPDFSVDATPLATRMHVGTRLAQQRDRYTIEWVHGERTALRNGKPGVGSLQDVRSDCGRGGRAAGDLDAHVHRAQARHVHGDDQGDPRRDDVHHGAPCIRERLLDDAHTRHTHGCSGKRGALHPDDHPRGIVQPFGRTLDQRPAGSGHGYVPTQPGAVPRFTGGHHQDVEARRAGHTHVATQGQQWDVESHRGCETRAEVRQIRRRPCRPGPVRH